MSAKFDEEELRKKIREQLEQEHSEKKEYFEKQLSEESVAAFEDDESYYLEIYIRRKLQDEVFSKYPEFVQCGNHLDQIKWLTPLEMEEEYEFFPVEYTFWSKIKKAFSGKAGVKIPDTPVINKMIEQFREEIENEAVIRIKKYKEYIDQRGVANLDDQKKKIIAEEQDRFYKSLKGYHKYKNHIGETTWMTEDEFNAQDEFTDRIYSPVELALRGLILFTSLIILLSGIIYTYSLFSPQTFKGYILVETSDSKAKASLYINQNLAVGFTPGIPYPVDEGLHEIALISPKFKTVPSFHKVEILDKDTVNIKFQLIEVNENSAIVRLNVPFEDAGVYADGEFKGTIQKSGLLSLPVGDHTISVRKANYISTPRLHTFSLNAGDTIDLSFRLTQMRNPAQSSPSSSSINVGLIEVNSNVRGAEIFLNGNKTGFSTDYVFQKIPLGQHIVRLEKEGYAVYPEEQVVKLTSDERTAKVDFTLASTNRYVTIIANPKHAPIYVDGKEIALGTFRGAISLGEHELSFGNLANYKNPGKQKITITKDGQNRFEFTYDNDLFYEIKPATIKPAGSEVRVSSGYILNGINFKANSTNGPEILLNNKVNENVWHMGFAFQYKNPPGSDALYIRFELPNDLNISNDTKLKLWLYQSNENYPLVISGKSGYMVAINNKIIVENKQPDNNISQISEDKFEEINVAGYLKSGINNLIISCTPENSRFMHLWKIVIN